MGRMDEGWEVQFQHDEITRSGEPVQVCIGDFRSLRAGGFAGGVAFGVELRVDRNFGSAADDGCVGRHGAGTAKRHAGS